MSGGRRAPATRGSATGLRAPGPCRGRSGGFRGAARRAGFTLIEILVTLAVAGVLGMAILTLVLGQNRFYAHSDDAIYAQQSLRAAMDLMASELRMASPEDLIVATADSVSVRFDLVRSIVCDSTDADEATLFVFDSVGNANLPAAFRGTAYSGAYDSTFAYADGWTGTVTTTGAAPKADCTSRGAPSDGESAAYRRVTGWQAAFGGDVPDRGSMVRVYGRLTYRFADSGFGAGIAVWRNDQELVSPFEEGPVFHYVMADGTVQSTVALGDLANVRAIRIAVTARGDGINRFNVRRPIDYEVPLRN